MKRPCNRIVLMAHKEATWKGIWHVQYMVIWAVLLILTVVEVIVPEPSLIGLEMFPRTFVVLSLILLALVKTILVAGYYMHVIGDKPAIVAVACAPFLFSIFLTVGIFPY